jgi:two-component system nitrate/nitrite response regulator NarL
MSTTPIRVLLADDHPLMREGLSRAVRGTEGLTLVAACADGYEALEAIQKHRPDVALLDIDMPGMTGLDVLREIRKVSLDTRVVILTGAVDEEWVYAAITSGASGYIIKSADWKTVRSAIHDAAEGRTVIDPSMSGTLAGALQRRKAEEEVSLTERERQVLDLTNKQLTAKEVGAQLNVSDRMVKRHLTNIYEKLNVDGKRAAIIEAQRRGLIP